MVLATLPKYMLEAIDFVLRTFLHPYTIHFYTDSHFASPSPQRIRSCSPSSDLFSLLFSTHKISFHKIKGHSSNYGNGRADSNTAKGVHALTPFTTSCIRCFRPPSQACTRGYAHNYMMMYPRLPPNKMLRRKYLPALERSETLQETT